MSSRKISSALISVYHKDGLESLVRLLDRHQVKIYSTGGTQKFIEDLGIKVTPVENLTTYPAIFGGRVKTLHPAVFGGILYRRNVQQDINEAAYYNIQPIDLVIVDLYPFEETVNSGADEADVIEKIDIGGVSLIRAAAKNYNDVVIISNKNQYPLLEKIISEQQCTTSLNERRLFAAHAFDATSHYDTAIFNYFFSGEEIKHFKQSIQHFQVLRYGENPHQTGVFYGRLPDMFDKLNGKELSYNNLVDIDAAIALIDEFSEPTFAILKHTNACGVASADTPKQAYISAFECDPVSAFGGVIVSNRDIDWQTAEEMNNLFFEVLIAPGYEQKALDILKEKKNRIILKRKPAQLPEKQFKTLLNGVIEQDKDLKTEDESDFKYVTHRHPTEEEKKAMIFANKIVKHTKSNAIVLAKNGQLIASGVGQTSRIDALKQAIEKAENFGFTLHEAVMASDAFFPFPDCVELADKAGIKAIIQPGGSVRDQESIDYCNANGIAMVFTGIRHFKH
ncbi:MAG: bifunctional phosphoribosylaminoimidazolecarboxamide formyltransferase/IMP cyclohydrolase [Cytophagaceae bacterium]|nr:bifunctional phosphoribosylaminoimidazolecarboxamide formyltransferase/IMP cyclohydrolase [Cytophagaceae bacterium]MDW8456360.1 bifunctional phosphoribosylaminoimidazolecarboxamide formyltransferase/IMP cyclohydrolase [Cytophagaceae bacterium]